MKRTAQVAYTPGGASNVNRLRSPEYGLVRLLLKTDHKTSKSHLPDGVAPGPAGNQGTTNDFCFAPRSETAQLMYQIHDPLCLVREAKLELFVRFRREPVWILDLGSFGPSWRSHGEHAIAWDGRIVKADGRRDDVGIDGKVGHTLCDIPADLSSTDFPDGYVNLQHTSYKLKMTIGADGLVGAPAVAWTYFHVLVDRLELEFGPAEVLPLPSPGQADHRAMYADLVRREPKPPHPSESKTVKVLLNSDVYRQPAVPLGAGSCDDRRFEAHRGRWNQGPLIPLFAKVLIRDSADRGVESPKAIGRARFLWEWESMSEQVATGRASDKVVNHAQGYGAHDSRPRGQNCHIDRGGKRGPRSLPVFPAQAGYPPRDTLADGAFPFEVAPVPEHRTWAVYSYAWREKALAGRTGVLFQPSRMAGDAYKVTVYLAWDVGPDGENRLDTDEQPLVVPSPDRVSASTGTFQIWRRIHWRKHLAKSDAGLRELHLDEIARRFAAAYLDLAGDPGAPGMASPEDWDAAVARATADWDETSKLLLAKSAQHTDAAGVVFRSRGEFSAKWKEREIAKRLSAIGCAEHAASIARAASGGADANAAADLATATAATEGYDGVAQARIAKTSRRAWAWVERRMSQPPLHTRASYAMWLQQEAIDLLTEVFNASADQTEGIGLFQVARVHNLCDDLTAVTSAAARRQSSPDPGRCGVLLMGAGDDNALAREVARRLFLSTHEGSPGQCLLSSQPDAGTGLCGACQLRLRGWMGDGEAP